MAHERGQARGGGGLGRADCDIFEADRTVPAIGRLVHVGIVDELSERTVAIIEDDDGRLRYAGFDRSEDQAVFAGIVRGAMVEFTPRVAEARPADEVVARIADATGGLYSPAHHAALARQANPALIAGNVRRLEAMRRASLVTRRPDGRGRVQPDQGCARPARRARVANHC